MHCPLLVVACSRDESVPGLPTIAFEGTLGPGLGIVPGLKGGVNDKGVSLMPTKVGTLLARKRRNVLVDQHGAWEICGWFDRREGGIWRIGQLYLRVAGRPERPVILTERGYEFTMPEKPKIQGNGVLVQSADKGTWAKTLPALVGWLCDGAFNDGTPVGQTRLSVRRVGTGVVACLQCESCGGIRCEAQGVDPETALAALDALLRSKTPPWTSDPYPLGRLNQKGKK